MDLPLSSVGLGDELMAVGEAAALSHSTGRKVAIGRDLRSLVHSPMELHCPWVVQRGEDVSNVELLRNYEGHRPYIDYQSSVGGRQVTVSSHRPRPGRLFFSDEENDASYGIMTGLEKSTLVAPHVKGSFSGPNKGWPPGHWRKLVRMLAGLGHQVVQISPPKTPEIKGVHGSIKVPVRLALASMRWAACVVTTEGLLHHAAAGIALPAVVLWGERTDPNVLGYAGQQHLVNRIDGRWCGSTRRVCDHCTRAMEGITPGWVVAAVEDALK